MAFWNRKKKWTIRSSDTAPSQPSKSGDNMTVAERRMLRERELELKQDKTLVQGEYGTKVNQDCFQKAYVLNKNGERVPIRLTPSQIDSLNAAMDNAWVFRSPGDPRTKTKHYSEIDEVLILTDPSDLGRFFDRDYGNPERYPGIAWLKKKVFETLPNIYKSPVLEYSTANAYSGDDLETMPWKYKTLKDHDLKVYFKRFLLVNCATEKVRPFQITQDQVLTSEKEAEDLSVILYHGRDIQPVQGFDSVSIPIPGNETDRLVIPRNDMHVDAETETVAMLFSKSRRLLIQNENKNVVFGSWKDVVGDGKFTEHPEYVGEYFPNEETRKIRQQYQDLLDFHREVKHNNIADDFDSVWNSDGQGTRVVKFDGYVIPYSNYPAMTSEEPLGEAFLDFAGTVSDLLDSTCVRYDKDRNYVIRIKRSDIRREIYPLTRENGDFGFSIPFIFPSVNAESVTYMNGTPIYKSLTDLPVERADAYLSPVRRRTLAVFRPQDIRVSDIDHSGRNGIRALPERGQGKTWYLIQIMENGKTLDVEVPKDMLETVEKGFIALKCGGYNVFPVYEKGRFQEYILACEVDELYMEKAKNLFNRDTQPAYPVKEPEDTEEIKVFGYGWF